MGMACGVGLLVAAGYAYLYHGWFESGTLGQTQHLHRIHAEGIDFKSQRSFGLFPRAVGLLREPFSHNGWDIRSADGALLYRRKPTRWVTPLTDIPPHVRAPFLFAEDCNFAHHTGVDWRGIMRAAWKSMSGRLQGGSTIAMQVAKLCLLEYRELPKRSLILGMWRKVRETMLA